MLDKRLKNTLNKYFNYRSTLKIISLVCIVILMSVSYVQAHPGRTDSRGGHHVTATGEYHYHHGMSAHDHPSPYRKTLNTSINDKGVSNTGKEFNYSYILIGIALYFGIGKTLSYVRANHKNKKQVEKNKKQFEEEKNKYLNLYGGKSVYEVANVPKNIKFDDRDLPISVDESGLKWGKEFTVYKTTNGQCFHKKCGCSGATIPVHIFNIGYKIKGCTKCTSGEVYIKPDWYKKYLEINRIKKRYGI